MFVLDNETAASLRTATAHADAKNWPAALSCMQEIKERAIKGSGYYPLSIGCKYALYFSRAGRFEESMREFDAVLDDLPRQVREESALDNPDVFVGKGASKKTLYHLLLKEGKREIEEKRGAALRRMAKSLSRDNCAQSKG